MMIVSLLQGFATTERAEIGLGALWKSKKLFSVFVWNSVLAYAAYILATVDQIWPAVAVLGMGTFTVGIYVFRQAGVDAVKTGDAEKKVNGFEK